MDSKEQEKLIRDLIIVEKTIAERERVTHVSTYGLPDLLFPIGYKPGKYVLDYQDSDIPLDADVSDGWVRERLGYHETPEQYAKRQNTALEEVVTNHLKIIKDGKEKKVFMIRAMHDFISGVFFLRTTKVIIWKPRGGGGSLSAAILIFLLMAYRKREVLDLAGSGEQAMCVYNYVRDFCDLIPGFSNMIAGDTTKSKATFLNGGDVLAIPATDKQVRGKHKSVLIIDEACQNDREIVFKAALQGTMSEDDPIVVLLSTFHLPSGFYQEHWDGAEEKGFHKVRWSIIDTMSPCVKWQEYLTKTDPDGHDFCMNRCPFTVNKQVMDASGKLTFKEKTGCCGSGRTSDGWLSYEKVLAPYKLNLGTSIFDIEYLCSRPNYENSVYSPELVDDALSIPLSICSTDDLAVGIDWGLETTNSLAITLVARQLEYLYIHACVLTDHKLVKDVADLLNSWMTIAGKRFPILADSSHPFNNAELSQAGFDVRPVNFGTWKKFGIENVSKYLTFRRIKINQELLILISQLKKFRRDTRGRIVKHEDHAVDSAMCAILNWKFEEEFGEDIARARVLDPVERFTLPRAAYSFDDSGIAKVVVAGALKKDVQETGVKEKGSILLI